MDNKLLRLSPISPYKYRLLFLLCFVGYLGAIGPGCQTAKPGSLGTAQEITEPERSKTQTHELHVDYFEYNMLPTYHKLADPVALIYELEGDNPLDHIEVSERNEIEAILRRVSELENPSIVRRVLLAWPTYPNVVIFDVEDGAFQMIRIVIVKVGETWVFSNSSISIS